MTSPSKPSARSAAAPFTTSRSLRKRTCVEMSGREIANVPLSPQQRSDFAILDPSAVVTRALTVFIGSCSFIGVWQGSWYM